MQGPTLIFESSPSALSAASLSSVVETPEYSPVTTTCIDSPCSSSQKSSTSEQSDHCPVLRDENELLSTSDTTGTCTGITIILANCYSYCLYLIVEQKQWNGYVLAGDNLDRNVRPRHQTVHSQTRSMHWFNSIVVKDRCDFSMFTDQMPVPDTSSFDVQSFLPNSNDCRQLIANVSKIVARILVKYIPGFSKFSSLVEPHIKHSYSSEMSSRSHVVSSIQYVVTLFYHFDCLGSSWNQFTK